MLGGTCYEDIELPAPRNIGARAGGWYLSTDRDFVLVFRRADGRILGPGVAGGIGSAPWESKKDD